MNNIPLLSGRCVNQFLNLHYQSKRRNVEMADRNLVCKDCGKEFVFTEGEQAFYKEKGFENDPVRCPECRKARKQQNNRGFRR
jgi:DNA-directed RNA polymerase subunit RPC12/RpoP